MASMFSPSGRPGLAARPRRATGTREPWGGQAPAECPAAPTAARCGGRRAGGRPIQQPAGIHVRCPRLDLLSVAAVAADGHGPILPPTLPGAEDHAAALAGGATHGGIDALVDGQRAGVEEGRGAL